MPELPEVEVVKKSLEKTIYDLRIKNVKILNKSLRYKINEKLMKRIMQALQVHPGWGPCGPYKNNTRPQTSNPQTPDQQTSNQQTCL